jgi:hypothetical protein
LDRSLIGDSVASALCTESVRAQTRIGDAHPRAAADGLWERSAERAATVPEREYERLRRVAALRGHSVDATHPPTHLRRHLVEAGSSRRRASSSTRRRPPRSPPNWPRPA